MLKSLSLCTKVSSSLLLSSLSLSLIHNKKYTKYTQFITTDNKRVIAAEEDSSAERE